MLLNGKNSDIEILKWFLGVPLNNQDMIMNKFLSLKNAIYRQGQKREEGFVFVERMNALATVVAHADTVFNNNTKVTLYEKEGNIYSKDLNVGLGADDRAGCAICWLLKKYKVNILITNGEEIGAVGSQFLKEKNLDVLEKINKSKFVIQFDRKNSDEYKTVNATKDFCNMIENYFHFTLLTGERVRTDIINLCERIPGATISIGYYNPHTVDEYLNIQAWQNTLNKSRYMFSNLI